MREIPSFADLMLLPTIVQRDARVFVKDDRIAVETRFPASIVKVMSAYPHVRVIVDGDGHVVLAPREARQRRLVLVWPSGRRQGVLVWERGFYSLIDAGVMTSLIAAGCAVETLRCEREESVVDALSRLPRFETDGSPAR
jgi:hypothetical protein